MAQLSFDVELRGPLFVPQLREAFAEEIDRELAELTAIGQRMVVKETPRGASGLLRGSVITELRGTPLRVGVVLSSMFYAPYVERGRRPGRRPPVAALRLWVVRKLGIRDAKQARAVAFVIARKIGRVGTGGAAMFFKASQRLEPIAQARWQALGQRIARRLGGA